MSLSLQVSGVFCSCKFIILGRSPAKVDHCNSPSCILKGNIAHPPSCIHLLHLCQNCLETLQIGISSMKVGPRNICPKIMSMHFNIQRHISCPALRSFSMRWGSISGAKAISYKAYKKKLEARFARFFFFWERKTLPVGIPVFCWGDTMSPPRLANTFHGHPPTSRVHECGRWYASGCGKCPGISPVVADLNRLLAQNISTYSTLLYSTLLYSTLYSSLLFTLLYYSLSHFLNSVTLKLLIQTSFDSRTSSRWRSLCFVMSFHPFLHIAWDLKLIHTHSGIFPTLPTFLGVRDTTVGWMGVFLDEAKAANATQKLS